MELYKQPLTATTLALVAVVTSDVLTTVSATACIAADVCASPAGCTDASGTTPISRPSASELQCDPNKFAYIKSAKVAYIESTDKDPSMYGLMLQNAGSPVFTYAPTVSGVCANTYADVGKDTTADLSAIVSATGGRPNYIITHTIEWACQAADSCALSCTDAKCVPATIPKSTPLPLTRPPISDLPVCVEGNFVYLSSLEVGVDKATRAGQITVAFTNGPTATSTLTAIKDTSTCDGHWTDVGKMDATADVQATITCLAAVGATSSTRPCGRVRR